MAGVYCSNCKTGVLLEQDGQSCSNCGTQLTSPKLGAKPPQRRKAPPGPPKGHVPKHVIRQVDAAEFRRTSAEAAEHRRWALAAADDDTAPEDQPGPDVHQLIGSDPAHDTTQS